MGRDFHSAIKFNASTGEEHCEWFVCGTKVAFDIKQVGFTSAHVTQGSNKLTKWAEIFTRRSNLTPQRAKNKWMICLWHRSGFRLLCFWVHRNVNYARWRVNNKIVLMKAHGSTWSRCTLRGLSSYKISWHHNTITVSWSIPKLINYSSSQNKGNHNHEGSMDSWS